MKSRLFCTKPVDFCLTKAHSHHKTKASQYHIQTSILNQMEGQQTANKARQLVNDCGKHPSNRATRIMSRTKHTMTCNDVHQHPNTWAQTRPRSQAQSPKSANRQAQNTKQKPKQGRTKTTAPAPNKTTKTTKNKTTELDQSNKQN